MFTSPWPSITGDKEGGSASGGGHPVPHPRALHFISSCGSLFLRLTATGSTACAGKSLMHLVSVTQRTCRQVGGSTRWTLMLAATGTGPLTVAFS